MRYKNFYGWLVMCIALGCSDGGSSDSACFACQDGEKCIDGVCKAPANAGEPCGMDAFCVSGECVDGMCEDVGQHCNESADCADENAYCAAGVCRQKVSLGEYCTENQACLSGMCLSRKCTTIVQPGQTCDLNRLCAEGADCHIGVCKTPVDMGGDCRSSLVYCANGMCSQGKCVAEGERVCQDTDGDGISDEYDRCDIDTDRDGLVDCMDLDSDGDTIPDEIERASDPCAIPMDSNLDGLPDFLSTDSDGNDIPDAIEAFLPDGSLADTDGDGIYDYADLDNDGDTIADIYEIEGLLHPKYTQITGPRGADCYHAEKKIWGVWGYGKIMHDDRNMPYYEPCDPTLGDKKCQPRMGDFIPDERGSAEKPFDCNGDTVPDYLTTDSDGDGILDSYESRNDSDGDGFYDRYELDSDNDGLPDREELGGKPGSVPVASVNVLHPDYTVADIDDDGLVDGSEVRCYLPIECAEGNASIDGSCVDIKNDARHCGESLTRCPEKQVCIDGSCQAADIACEESQSPCWGTCQSLQIDVQNCGACGNACGDNQTCDNGACVMNCSEGTVAIDGECIDTNTNPAHCGAAQTACLSQQICKNGACVESDKTCHNDLSLCHDTCAYLLTDVNHCGACDIACAKDQICQFGVCIKNMDALDGFQMIDTRLHKDSDNDGFDDASEFIAGEWYRENVNSNIGAKEFICSAQYGVTPGVDPDGNEIEGAFDFYFTLPYQGMLPENERTSQEDFLEFSPAVSKLDVVFNLDTTKSMGAEVDNLKKSLSSVIIPAIKQRVSESAIGVSRFDDFPTRPTSQSMLYDYLQTNPITEGGYGLSNYNDLPFVLVSRPETDAQKVQSAVDSISLHHGGDYPEAGYEALWQLVKGDDDAFRETSWTKYGNYAQFSSGIIPKTPKTPGRWGGGQFRDQSLPVVVHITDTTAHDTAQNCDTIDQSAPARHTCIPYDPAYVNIGQDMTGDYPGGHYSDNVHKAYREKGARIISIYDNATDNERFGKTNVQQLTQLVDTSTATAALVPVCAFKMEDSTWKCGENQCCTLMNDDKSLSGVPAVDHNCVLSYGIANGNVLTDVLVDGVDALVKYAASEVAVRVKGKNIDDNVDTSCFIKRVEAFSNLKDRNGISRKGYVAPPQEPEASCNPVAKPAAFDNADYDNGYTNFAIGTSSKDKIGAKLNFHIVAQNDRCVKPTEQSQVFEAYIELYEPTTGMSFGERKISIVVPGEKNTIIVN